MRRGRGGGERKWREDSSSGRGLVSSTGRKAEAKHCKRRRRNSSWTLAAHIFSLSSSPPSLSLSLSLSLFLSFSLSSLSVWSSWCIELGSWGHSPPRARHRPQTSCRDVTWLAAVSAGRARYEAEGSEWASERTEARDDVDRYDSLFGSRPADVTTRGRGRESRAMPTSPSSSSTTTTSRVTMSINLRSSGFDLVQLRARTFCAVYILSEVKRFSGRIPSYFGACALCMYVLLQWIRRTAY